ncbi:hypothetical protein [Roseibium sp. M-1]
MSRTLISLLVFFLLSFPLKAASDLPLGLFKVVNTEGFVQQDGVRQPLETDMSEGTARIELDSDDSLMVEINGAGMRLFPLDQGLAALAWDANGTGLLHGIDIVALFGKEKPADVPAWGANLDWPGSGKVQLVLLPIGEKAYSGFLISHPGSKTVVRQMEFRQAYGHSDRPGVPLPGDASSERRP